MLRALTILAFLLPVAPASGAEIDVGPGKTHASLTGAIAAAEPGDTLRVHPGIYREGKIVIGKPLTLAGIGRPVLDGENKHDVVLITASDVILRGFAVRADRTASSTRPARCGSAITAVPGMTSWPR